MALSRYIIEVKLNKIYSLIFQMVYRYIVNYIDISHSFVHTFDFCTRNTFACDSDKFNGKSHTTHLHWPHALTP